MGDFSRYLVTPTELINSAKKHWLKGVAIAGCMFAVLAAGIYLLPRKYESEAKLFVKIGLQTLTLDATAQTGQTVSIYESRENEINSILEILRSRQVLDLVVERLGASAILHHGAISQVVDSAAGPKHTPIQSNLADRPDHEHEMAISALMQSIEVWSPKRTSIIGVRAQASSPELAQAIVATLLAVYRDVHLKVNSTQGSYDFFVEQERVLRDKSKQATAALRDAKDSIGVSTLDGKRKMLEAELGDIGQKLHAASSELAATEAKIASIQAKIKDVPQFTETSRAESPNVAADTMRGNLYTLQMKEKELLSKYTEIHPLVVATREQVTALQQLLDEEGRLRVQSTVALNPAWAQLESSLNTETANLDSTRAREKSLSSQRGQVLAQLKSLNSDEIRINQLQQNVALAEQSYRETATRLEQARIHRELTSEGVSNVNVAQAASFVSKAVSPKRSMLLVVALLASVMTGAMAVAAMSYVGRQFLSLADLADRLQLPVISIFPPQMAAAR